jgi:hypothetical protein
MKKKADIKSQRDTDIKQSCDFDQRSYCGVLKGMTARQMKWAIIKGLKPKSHD